MSIAVKICGLSNAESVEVAVQAGADYIGFVFFDKSPRNITPEKAAILAKLIPDSVKIVAVTVNANDKCLGNIVDVLNPDYIQLHGSETPERCAEIKAKFDVGIIKAFSVQGEADIEFSKAYKDVADIFLFDAKAPKDAVLPGGNAVSFDWQLLADKEFAKSWMLSGGLNKDNVKQAISISDAQMVDVSSGVESQSGVKDVQKIQEFIEVVKNI